VLEWHVSQVSSTRYAPVSLLESSPVHVAKLDRVLHNSGSTQVPKSQRQAVPLRGGEGVADFSRVSGLDDTRISLVHK